MTHSIPAGMSHTNINEITEKFRGAMSSHGLALNDELITDGSIHRFSQDGDKEKPCWYILHADGIPAGAFGCWKRHISENWFSMDISTLSVIERMECTAKAAEHKKISGKEKLITQQQAAIECQQILLKAQEPSPEHAYLIKKQICALTIKQQGNALLIPLRDEQGLVVNLQYIFPGNDGEFEKRFKSCARKSGCFHIIGKLTNRIWITEGYATGASVYLATNDCVIIAFDAVNLKPVAINIKSLYPSANIIIAGDNDHMKVNNTGLEKAQEAAKKICCKYVVPKFESGSTGTDFNDLMLEKGIDAVKDQLNKQLIENGLLCCDIQNFLSMELKPRENIVAPWFPTQGLVMVYASRGVGKTYFALTLAIAIASGGECFCWKAPKPRAVLYLDGEMPAVSMQDRLAHLITQQPAEISSQLKFITRDLNPLKQFSLTDKEGQKEIEKHLDGIDVIIVDNISTLCPVKENDADAWLPIQEWALQMRAGGISVLFIHHANKNGTARGTSKREDILDTVISMRRPNGYTAQDGAVFEVHFEKSRGFAGDDSQPVQISLTEDDGNLSWHTESVEQTTYQKVASLYNDGYTQSDIKDELEVNKGTVSKYIKRGREEGLITRKEK